MNTECMARVKHSKDVCLHVIQTRCREEVVARYVDLREPCPTGGTRIAAGEIHAGILDERCADRTYKQYEGAERVVAVVEARGYCSFEGRTMEELE